MADGRDELFYRLALIKVSGIGVKIGRDLLQQYGNATNIFKAPLKELLKVEGINEVKVKAFRDPAVFTAAEKELEFIIKEDISTIAYHTESYPARLAACADAPLLLFYKGNAALDMKRTIAIVGTRLYTDYGNRLTEELVEGLQGADILIISGLALGIDAIAHKKAVKLGIPTVGVLGTGLDKVYPFTHKALANEMVQNGGLLTEYWSGTIPDRAHFPMRNRIVAGLSDITVVIESDIKGGALITAMMANGYNREVAAYPGRVSDSKSSGCNELIRRQSAHLVTCADDVLELMDWKDGNKKKAVQKQLFVTLSNEQQKIVDLLQTKEMVHADDIFYHTGLANSELAVTLLDLEMQGIIKTLPGKQYRLT